MQFRFIVLCGLLLPIAAVEAATPFDGTYVGTIQMVGNGAAECTRNGHARVTVENGQVTYKHFNRGTLTARLNPDGSFAGDGQNYSSRTPVVQKMHGRISGNHLEMETSSQWCTYHLALNQRQ